ncbi:hypothetical protein SSS_04301 [Sarcoptes scabiei]|nr:hypothetical protein SSS_04301 [Sarcoptes scabiei]
MNLISHHAMTDAIRSMQKFANLPVTGVVDTQTLAMMRRPRCGLPDLPPSKNRSKRFVVYGPRWEKTPLLWSLNHPSRTLPSETARQIFTKAWSVWSKASNGLQFIETSGSDADILIGFYSGDHGCGRRQAFDGRGIKLAHAFAPPNGDVHFDDDEDWLDQRDEGISLFWTALHEFGHSLGFAHTADESSIMFPYYREHSDDFQLPNVDKAGLNYLYGDLATKSQQHPSSTSVEKNKEKNSFETPKTENEIVDSIDSILCATDIDAIASIRDEIFAFKNDSFWWIKNDLTLIRKEAIPIAQYFIGFPSNIERIDAVYERKSDQMIMIFVGKHYYLFNSNQYYDGPIPLTDLGLPERIENVDAVTDWGHNGRAYIFTGPVYWRLDANEKSVELDYPRDMSVWSGVPMNLDAAFTWRYDSSTYFFRNKFYWKFNNELMRTVNDYPKRLQSFLFRSISCDRFNEMPFYQKLQQKSASIRTAEVIEITILIMLIIINIYSHN